MSAFGPGALAFGQYGAYVWSAVGLFAFVTLVNVLAARAAYRRARERAARAQPKGPEEGAAR